MKKIKEKKTITEHVSVFADRRCGGRRRKRHRATRSIGGTGAPRESVTPARNDGAQRVVRRKAVRRPRRLPAHTDVDAPLPETGLALRRRVGHHRRAHADAPGHSVRVPGRTGPARK